MIIRELDPLQDEVQISILCELIKGPQFDWPPEKLRSEMQFSKGFILEELKQVRAFLLFRRICEQVLEISALATSPLHKKMGYMGSLFSHLINAHGHENEFWLEVHEKNLIAQNLYEKWGFKKNGVRPHYYSDGGSAILYTRAPDL